MRKRWRFENDMQGQWFWTTFEGESNNMIDVSPARFNNLQACIRDAEKRGCETGTRTSEGLPQGESQPGGEGFQTRPAPWSVPRPDDDS